MTRTNAQISFESQTSLETRHPAAQAASTPISFRAKYLELLERVRPVHERAERLRWSVFGRAAALCRRAGLEPELAGVQLHNFLIDAHCNRAWNGVSVPLAEESARLYARQFDGYRVYERYFRKLERELRHHWFGGSSPR